MDSIEKMTPLLELVLLEESIKKIASLSIKPKLNQLSNRSLKRKEPNSTQACAFCTLSY